MGTAGIAFALGATLSVLFARNAADSAQGKYKQAQCLIRQIAAGKAVKSQFDPNELNVERTGCSGYWLYDATIPQVYAEAARQKPNEFSILWNNASFGLAITGAVAAALYYFFIGIGWIVAGFTRDPD